MTIHVCNTDGELLVRCTVDALLEGTPSLDDEALRSLVPGEALEVSHGGRAFVVEAQEPSFTAFLRECVRDCYE